MYSVIAVDISGRHKINGRYYMVCAAVAVSVSASHIEKVEQISIRPFWLEAAPEIVDIVHIIEETIQELQSEGTIVTEQGDMYNQPQWLVEGMFSRGFKYQESLGERRAIELAHHISFSSRNLLLKELKISAESEI